MALLFTICSPPRSGLLNRMLDTVNLTVDQWLICSSGRSRSSWSQRSRSCSRSGRRRSRHWPTVEPEAAPAAA